MIYFDSTATTKPLKEVLDTYNKINEEYWYNPSGMYKGSVVVNSLIEKASVQIENILGLSNKTIYYTSGATEANNMAIMGICMPYINKGKHIITTYIEHPSVYNVFKNLENLGFNVTYLKCENGIVDLDELKNALTKDTILVSIMWVNNIIGSINPIKEIIEIAKKHSHAKLHVDAVQGITKIKENFSYNDIDLVSITFHKIEGLKGIGALIANKSIQLSPILKGGHQQKEIRPGTLDASLIVSSAKALRLAMENRDNHYNYVKKLYDYLTQKLEKLNHIKINKTNESYSPYVLSISINNLKGETAMHYLEESEIYVGIGSACNEKIETIERAIYAITKDNSRAINMIRISLSHHNTLEEIDKLVEKLESIRNL